MAKETALCEAITTSAWIYKAIREKCIRRGI